MAATTPTSEPSVILAGDTAKWLISLPDYPASDGWALAYTLINATAKITITASASGADHLVTAAAATTAAYTAGSYTWRSQVSRAGEVFTVATGTVQVQGSFGAATLDARSHERKALAAVEAYLENPQNLTAAMYEIAGRKLQRISIPDLLTLRDRYKAEVAREDAAAQVGRGLPLKNRIFVRFGA